MNRFFRENKRKICIFFPIFLGLVYMSLCLVRLNVSITTDEAELDYISRSTLDIAIYSQPPLTVFLFKIWGGLLGHDLATMRFLSVIFGIITILFVFKLVNYKYKTAAACASSTLLAISPFFVHCGSLIWFCTIFTALFAASSFFLQLYIDNGEKKWLIIYFILAALGIWTHYLFVLVWITHIIYLIICKKKKAILGFIVAFLTFIPWFPKMVSYFTYTHRSASGLSLSALANFWTETNVLLNAGSLKNFSALLLLASTIAFATALIKNKRQKLFVLSFTIPLALILTLVAANIMPFPPSRCLICITITVPIILGIALAKHSKTHKWRNSIIALIVLISSVFGLFNLYSGAACSIIGCSNANKVFANIEAFSTENEAIITYETDLYYQLKFYETDEHQVLTPSEIPEEDYWLVTSSGELNLDESIYEITDSATLGYSDPINLYKLHRK